MTKYILHGGRATQTDRLKQEFFPEILRELSNNLNILIVLFAREPEVWNEKFEEMKKCFSLVDPGKEIDFSLARMETALFVKQIKKADVVYFNGGDSHILQEHLAQVPDLQILLSGKVVAGSSAGALVFSQYYYENDDDTFNTGLGFLPVKIICHYTEEKADTLLKLREFGENIQNVYSLAEGEFVIIEQ